MKARRFLQARRTLRLTTRATGGDADTPWLPLSLIFARPQASEPPVAPAQINKHQHTISLAPRIHWMLATFLRQLNSTRENHRTHSVRQHTMAAPTFRSPGDVFRVHQAFNSEVIGTQVLRLIKKSYQRSAALSVKENNRLMLSNLATRVMVFEQREKQNFLAKTYRQDNRVIYQKPLTGKRSPAAMQKNYLTAVANLFRTNSRPAGNAIASAGADAAMTYHHPSAGTAPRAPDQQVAAQHRQINLFSAMNITHRLAQRPSLVSRLRQTLNHPQPRQKNSARAGAPSVRNNHRHQQAISETHEYRRRIIHLPDQTAVAAAAGAAAPLVRDSAPVPVVYRQSERQAQPQALAQAEPPPAVQPEIDITRISRDVMREIKKRQRVELERRGLL